MTDKEKIINAIGKAKKQSEEYGQDRIVVPFKEADMILAMLKEQEKATVISIHRNGFGSRVGACPNCQSVLHYEYNQSFCGKCDQAVKWDD